MSLVEFIAFPRKILLMTASYPQKDPSWSYKARGFGTFTTGILLLLTLAYNAFFHIDNFVRLTESSFIFISVVNVFLKDVVLTVKQKKFLALVGMLDTSSFTQDRVLYQSIVSNFLQIVRVVDFCYFSVVSASLLFRILYPGKVFDITILAGNCQHLLYFQRLKLVCFLWSFHISTMVISIIHFTSFKLLVFHY